MILLSYDKSGYRDKSGHRDKTGHLDKRGHHDKRLLYKKNQETGWVIAVNRDKSGS